MGFGVSLKQRWQWVMDKIESKVNRWNSFNLSMAGRVLLINHYIIPSVVYFLSCWRPPEKDLKQLIAICRRFLWAGATDISKLPKVKWETCIRPKEHGGLGIIDISQMADRMAGKWVIKCIQDPSSEVSVLLLRNLHRMKIKSHPKWSNLPMVSLLLSPYRILPFGSQLVHSIWQAWNRLKTHLRITDTLYRDAGIRFQDSIW